jgi:hypothetical protein
MSSQQEQRDTRRLSLQLPLMVKLSVGTVATVASQTKDISARGIFFYLRSEVSQGSPIEFTLTLPTEITCTENIRVHCSGKVVRVDRSKGSQVGIAAAIDQYEFLTE